MILFSLQRHEFMGAKAIKAGTIDLIGYMRAHVHFHFAWTRKTWAENKKLSIKRTFFSKAKCSKQKKKRKSLFVTVFLLHCFYFVLLLVLLFLNNFYCV